MRAILYGFWCGEEISKIERALKELLKTFGKALKELLRTFERAFNDD